MATLDISKLTRPQVSVAAVSSMYQDADINNATLELARRDLRYAQAVRDDLARRSPQSPEANNASSAVVLLIQIINHMETVLGKLPSEETVCLSLP